ncbi:4Fe-4S dicluster domain-containing protein [uncultured Campylobacter sp.]|uniref:ferredoxin family protein n=1 Tax=uncultured Campylobacter sp. TaxID=218934 RepID=UPI0026043316|nr:4Fe-4S dicluster domain-containing protein [uncultured Campylobacter sp.]
MINFGSVAERLNGNLYHLDSVSHIEVDQAEIRKNGIGKLLVAVCPAHVYNEEANGEISASYAACLECGTCLAVATSGLKWHYPKGGCGIVFKEG